MLIMIIYNELLEKNNLHSLLFVVCFSHLVHCHFQATCYCRKCRSRTSRKSTNYCSRISPILPSWSCTPRNQQVIALIAHVIMYVHALWPTYAAAFTYIIYMSIVSLKVFTSRGVCHSGCGGVKEAWQSCSECHM